MRPFLYFRDPLFLVGCCAYVINRCLIKTHVDIGFFHSYFNDFWLIPCALPAVLWLHRQLGLRRHDQPPQLSEIAFHLVFWSAIFEAVGPQWVSHATGDSLDVLAYTAGALLAGLWWRGERSLFRS